MKTCRAPLINRGAPRADLGPAGGAGDPPAACPVPCPGRRGARPTLARGLAPTQHLARRPPPIWVRRASAGGPVCAAGPPATAPRGRAGHQGVNVTGNPKRGGPDRRHRRATSAEVRARCACAPDARPLVLAPRPTIPRRGASPAPRTKTAAGPARMPLGPVPGNGRLSRVSAVSVVVREHPAAAIGEAPQPAVATSAAGQGCARHEFACAYTGTEPGRCGRCHSTGRRSRRRRIRRGWAAAPAPRTRRGTTPGTPAGPRPTPPARRPGPRHDASCPARCETARPSRRAACRATRAPAGVSACGPARPRPARPSIGMMSCWACSGDHETRDGQRWPGHDRSCPVGIAAGSTAPGPPPPKPDLRPATRWYGSPGEVADADGREERRQAWERAWEAARS